MIGQMNIYDYLFPDRINPLRTLVKTARPHWKDSEETLKRLIKTKAGIDEFTKAVKFEYIPHGAAGCYGSGSGPNTLKGWDMRNDTIKIIYTDHEGKEQTRIFSWKDFAIELLREMEE